MEHRTPMPVVIPGAAFKRVDPRELIVWVVGYLRVSSDGQAEKGFGLDVQEDCIAEYCARFPNWRFAGWFKDDGVSGTLTEREGIDEIIAFGHTQQIKFVVVARLNRQAREEYAGFFLDQQLKEIGATVVSATQDQDPYNIDLFMRSINRAVDAKDRREILKNTISGTQQAAEAGYWTNGPAPYGYEILGQGKKRSTIGVKAAEAKVLLRAVELVVDDGLSLADTAVALNAEGFRMRNGEPWTRPNLNKRLRSEAASGYSTYRNTSNRRTKLDEHGQPLHGAPVKRKLPEIISPDRYELLLLALEKNSSGPWDRSQPFWLRGHLKGYCGMHYVGGRNHTRARIYTCRGCADPKSTGCHDIQLKADLVEAAVWRAIEKKLGDPEQLRALAQEWINRLPKDQVIHQRNVGILEKEAEELQQTLVNITMRLEKPGLDPADRKIYEASRATTMLLWKTKTAELAGANERLERYAAQHEATLKMQALVNGARFRLENLTTDQKRVLARLLQVEVYVQEERTRPQYGKPSALEAWHRAENVPIPADPAPELEAEVLSVMHQHNPGLRAKAIPDARTLLMIRTILHRLRTGCRWMDLPEEFAEVHAATASSAQMRWWRNGTWTAVVRVLEKAGAGSPIATPTEMPPLRLTGYFRPDLFELDKDDVMVEGRSSYKPSEQSLIFSFSVEVS